MATVHKEFTVAVPAERIWDALADFDHVYPRLTPGFLTGCRTDGEGARIVTFINGVVTREVLVSCDGAARRLVYTVSGVRLEHHNASAQVVDLGDGTSRFVWIAEFLPDSLAGYIDEQMEAGALAMKGNLEKG